MKKGFTLVEALVAVSILALSIAGPMYTASQALIAAQNARYRLTAAYLAQEGIEDVRLLRDNMYLVRYQSGAGTATADSWSDFKTAMTVGGCGTGNSACILDPSAGTVGVNSATSYTLQPCVIAPSNTCKALYLDTTDNRYKPSNSGAGVAYNRTIQASPVGAGDEITITSTVTWSFHNKISTVTVTDHLTKWQ